MYFDSFEAANLNILTSLSEYVRQSVTLECNSTQNCPRSYSGWNGKLNVQMQNLQVSIHKIS